MGLLLAAAKIYIPQFIQQRKLAMLMEATAGAFRAAAPSTRGLSYGASLKLYAEFTREQAAASIQQGNELIVQSRLFQNACRIGQQFKKDFDICSSWEMMEMGRLIYSLLKIGFQGDNEGNIVIDRCFFSAYYSSSVCQLISSLDEGLLWGLSGGGRLRFSQRITEGHECCRAFLEAPGRSK
jgi:hypothetical protein